MDRTEASMAPARGGDRTDHRRRYRMRAGPMMKALVVIGLCAGNALWASAAHGAGAAKAAHRPAPSTPGLILLAPPSVAGPSSPFALRLGVAGGGTRSTLTLGLTVYKALTTPTAFDETLGGAPVGGVLSRPAPVDVSSLPSDSADPQTGVDLSVPVTAAGVTSPGTGPFTVDLRCELGSCGGVYPVLLELTNNASHTVTARLLTYLTYTVPAADTEPLRVALVVPLGLASTGSRVSSGAVTALTDVVNAVSGPRATVPLTLDPSPAALAALNHDRRSRAALTSLLSLTAEPGRQTLCGSFVPIDASALVTGPAGGATELTAQVRRGAQVLEAVTGLHTLCTTKGAWVSDTTLDSGALDALAALGYDDIVVPPTAVAGPPLATTPTRLFAFVGAPHTQSAVLSDPQLSALLQSTARPDPALAATQFLAELEFDYTEAPNTPDPRGVVVAPPADWRADPTVVTDVLDGLQANPMVEPVTLATLFTDVPPGGTVGNFPQPATHRPAADGGGGLPARALATARAQWNGFAAAVAGSDAGTTAATSLNDLLLESEAEQLTPAGQRAALTAFDAAFDHQLALLSIASREVRLTARTGSVPITVTKNAAYPVDAVLSVTSDKIAFSAGAPSQSNTECRPPVVTDVAGRSSVSIQCLFVHATNAVYIEMRSRVSGDFRMSVTLDSPAGGLQLASGQLTVRSLSTSAVAIALSVAAVLVLLGWWGRTMWRARRTRHGAHRRGGGGA